MLLTIFSIPKPFVGHIGLIQRNALASWRRLTPSVDVILLGSDEGVAAAADEFGFQHKPNIEVNEYGTPLISDAFKQVRLVSRSPYILYSNADILYDTSLLAVLSAVKIPPKFLLSARRWDIQVADNLKAAPNAVWQQVFADRKKVGHLHGPAGMDCFLFPRELDFCMPRFAVGRVGWDGWLVWNSRRTGVPVIDASADLAVIHQNHDYSSLKMGYQHNHGPERDLNIHAAGGLFHLLTLREATHELVCGTVRPLKGWRAVSSRLATYAPYHWALACKRWLQLKFA